MASELMISTYLLAGVASAVAVGFSFPPIDHGGIYGSNRAQVEEVVQKEQGHCDAVLDGVNCLCYANRAAYVMSHERTEVFGYNYVNKNDLARTQAEADC